MAEENQADTNTGADQGDVPDNQANATAAAGNESPHGEAKTARAHRSQKVGAVVSDKMQKTVVVRVDRLVKHTKYRRYVRRTSKFMAHDELGATIGDKVRIVETRPMSARKRWRVIEIVQKAAK
jgi:small subunit ribosomal protein S17